MTRKNALYRRLIHTVRWLELRRDVLTRSPLCQRCKADGYITPATEVHHVVPVEDALTPAEQERLMFDPSNLRPLCRACHTATHTEMGRCGRMATRRRNQRQRTEAIARFFGNDEENLG